MSVFKMNGPDELTGDSTTDIANMHAYMGNLFHSLYHVLSNIDSDNLSEDIINAIGIETED